MAFPVGSSPRPRARPSLSGSPGLSPHEGLGQRNADTPVLFPFKSYIGCSGSLVLPKTLENQLVSFRKEASRTGEQGGAGLGRGQPACSAGQRRGRCNNPGTWDVSFRLLTSSSASASNVSQLSSASVVLLSILEKEFYFIHKYFILLDAIINEILFLISFSSHCTLSPYHVYCL